jgi:hypothetical protein
MLHRCTSKFELEQGEIDLAKEYISTGGAAAIDQERGSVQPLMDLDQMSPSVMKMMKKKKRRRKTTRTSYLLHMSRSKQHQQGKSGLEAVHLSL